ncbi:hypothetical protein AHF37_08128 [Paragonimus kellicotti]|nr:hypothetical protein AHF37_08128 [Paragonimus kellicotti]
MLQVYEVIWSTGFPDTLLSLYFSTANVTETNYPESDDSSNDPLADTDHRMVTPVEAVDLLRRQICLPRDLLDAFQLGLTATSLSHITDTIQPIDSSMVHSKGGFCFQVSQP